jgi:hypothetical protein
MALSRRPFRSHPFNNSRTGRRSHRRPGRTVRDRANGPRRAPPFDLRLPGVGGAALMPTGLGAIAVLDAEQGHPDANIRSFADPLWSATTTVAPGRLRRLLPGTTTGRLVAVALMVMCIALVGAVTASVAVARGQRRATGDREDEVVAPSALADRQASISRGCIASPSRAGRSSKGARRPGRTSARSPGSPQPACGPSEAALSVLLALPDPDRHPDQLWAQPSRRGQQCDVCDRSAWHCCRAVRRSSR